MYMSHEPAIQVKTTQKPLCYQVTPSIRIQISPIASEPHLLYARRPDLSHPYIRSTDRTEQQSPLESCTQVSLCHIEKFGLSFSPFPFCPLPALFNPTQSFRFLWPVIPCFSYDLARMGCFRSNARVNRSGGRVSILSSYKRFLWLKNRSPP